MATVVKRSLNVGVSGMGKMGVPIASSIAFKAHGSVYLQIHSRSMQRAKTVCDNIAQDGATCAMRLHDKYTTLAKWCDVVLLCLADVDAARHALLEDNDALLRHCKQGQIIVDHTTVDVETSRECSAVARKRGAVFLDAPMSGNPKAAFNGTLTLMVGGDEDAFQKVSPIFRMYADNVHRLGDSGSGSAGKGIAQALVAVHNVAAAEAMLMAHTLGIDSADKLLKALDSSWASSTMLRRGGPIMQDLVRNPEKVPPAASTNLHRLMHDVSMLHASHAGSEAGVQRYPLLSRSVEVMEAGINAGAGDRDLGCVIHFLQARAQPSRQEPSAPQLPAAAVPPLPDAPAAAKAPSLAEDIEFY
jgi:3-hydroxyisobutyrate dehydrogenase